MEAVHGFFSNGSCICVLLPSVYWTLCTKIAIPLLPHAQWHWRCDVSQNRQAPQHPLCSKNSLFPSDCRSIKPLPFFLVLVKSIFLNCACLEWFGVFFFLVANSWKMNGAKKGSAGTFKWISHSMRNKKMLFKIWNSRHRFAQVVCISALGGFD